ncbi:MAG TPA: hypothetical protein VGB69_04070 [Edaphobacter sp.]
MTEPIEPTRNDPTPQRRQGDSRFLPVVIITAIALVLVLIASVVLIKGRGSKITPDQPNNHPRSGLAISLPQAA